MTGGTTIKNADQNIISALRYDDSVNKLIEAEECFNELLDMDK